MSRIRGFLIAAGPLATVLSTLSVYPHQLAYFNELAGGPENGHKHLLHSNLDWGQDLLLLKEWLDDFPNTGLASVIYHGDFDVRHLGVSHSLRASEFLQGNFGTDSSTHFWAVSQNFLTGARWHTYDARGARFAIVDRSLIEQLTQSTDPVHQVGATIQIRKTKQFK